MDLTIPDLARQVRNATVQALRDPELAQARAALAGSLEVRRKLVDRWRALGLQDLDLASPDGVVAAGHAAFAAGTVASPIPVAALLAGASAGLDGQPLQAMGFDGPPLLDQADLFPSQTVIDPGGTLRPATLSAAARRERRLAPFAAVAELGSPQPGDPRCWIAHEVFSAFNSLGGLETAIEHTRRHANDRVQFGKPLRAFQTIEHRYAEMVIAYAGLWELAHFEAWRLGSGGATLADGLALRAHHLEVTRQVLRSAHQTHGSIGFCDEHDLSVVTRSLQYRQYVPLDRSRTVDALARHIDDMGLVYTPDV